MRKEREKKKKIKKNLWVIIYLITTNTHQHCERASFAIKRFHTSFLKGASA
jgi:hypothetical protein